MTSRALRATLVGGLVAALTASVLALVPATSAQAITGADWDPGYIISDQAFFNGWAMSADQVQAFLNQKVPVCQDGYTCLKDYHQATPNQAADKYCAAYVGSPDERASDIIAKVGMACNVSEKAILVILQKEQGLVTHTWPSPSRFDKAMGFGCPDTVPVTCDPAYGTFFYQVYRAARQLERYGDPSTIYTWYPVGATTWVRYSTNVDCGGAAVFIRNRATAALYYYTPYQPNAAALANMPGIGDGCSAYGNRNFWYFYWNYFGSPLGSGITTVDGISPGFGALGGGTQVTITGSALTGATSVTFDGVAATNVVSVSDGKVTATTPPGTSATAAVLVTTPGGVSNASSFAYLAAGHSVVTGTPERIVDAAGFAPGAVRCYAVTGRAHVPDGAESVLLNVTVSAPSGNGYVVVYPDALGNGATPAPLSSTLNFEPGRDVANSTMLALPADGKVCAYSQGSTVARLIIDVGGYVVPGSGITTQAPQRLLDTRAGAGQLGPVVGPVEPGAVNSVQVTGNAGVPAGATAVVANVTVVGPTTEGHLRMWAAGTTVPNTSVVNYAPGRTKANGQIIALGASGQMSFESFTGVGTATNPVQVIVDVVGYIAAGSQFAATAPTRIVETRASAGVVGPIPGALVPNTVYPVTLSDTALIPPTATAVVLNVTAVGPTEFGNLRVYPDANGLGTTAPPLASNINYIPGRAIPNMVIVQIPSDRMIDFYNNQGLPTSRTDLIVDVIGYINGPTA